MAKFKPKHEGGEYTADEIEMMRNAVIILRDAALSGGEMQYAVTLSHNIGILSQLIEHLDPARNVRRAN